MKIKLSKSQWEEVGRKAGWIKISQQKELSREVCKRCHGNKFISEKVQNLGTSEYRDNIETCPSCKGKGYTTEEDRKESNDSYLHSMGLIPCPYGNDCSCGNIDYSKYLNSTIL